MAANTVFAFWGRLAFRHRRIIPIVIVALIGVLYIGAGTSLGSKLSQEGWFDPHAESTTARHIEYDTFGRDKNGDVIVLFHAKKGHTVDEPAAVAGMASYLQVIKAAHPNTVVNIVSYSDKRAARFVNKDKTIAFAAIGLAGDGEQTLKDYRSIKKDLVPPGPLAAGITVSLAGGEPVADALDGGMSLDIHRAEIYALPAVAVLLLIIFGSVIAAAMPLIVGILSILGSLGVLSILASATQVNVFAQSVVTLLGLGLAIDYGLFMVSRFREELAAGATTRDAVITTTTTAGKTVVFSASMVAVALSGLIIFPQAFLKSIAYGAMSAVGLAAILSLTVLPSMFAMLGKNIDRFTVRRTHFDRDPADGFFGHLPRFASRHAKATTLVIVVGMLALALPMFGIKFGGINETYLPPDNPVRIAQETFDEQFPDLRTEPVKLVVTGATDQQLSDIYQKANEVTGLTGHFHLASETKNGTTVLAAGVADRSLNKSVVDQLKAIAAPPGVKMYIGGIPALEVESIQALFDTLPTMAIYIIVVTFLLMSLAFGSMILPAKAVIMTILGLGSTLGILTAMFIDGVGGSLFNFTPGPLMSPVVVLIVAIVYGLSTDYEVFLLSRMVEARDRGQTTRQAIVTGTARTGSIITAAAVIMIVVCGAFGFSRIVMMKYIAFGMITALVLDATIIRMLLVPAVMTLLGTDNWWAPRWVRTASNWVTHGASRTRTRVPSAAAAATGHNETTTVSAPAQREQSYPAQPEPPAESIDAIAPAERVATRSGRTTADDDELIPFDKLVARHSHAHPADADDTDVDTDVDGDNRDDRDD